ncbi:uncharacterized protein LOC110271987 [Arachis ipaensis]|uniref:uncharacterized protein LOC110271987 n=1 Tax=Arachis ipaensis TaxID=130454 RepID=UPI000A2B798A|nr:uncharacterized protein LOC110271987 [Arachis ipaensis]XP_025652314.1 transcription factor MYB73-like [Arachis hypogaea]
MKVRGSDGVSPQVEHQAFTPEEDDTIIRVHARFTDETFSKKGRKRRIEARAEFVEEGDAVVDDEVDVRDVGDEAVGEAVALMVNGAGGESGLGEVDGGELEEPAGFAGKSVNDSEGSGDGCRG